LLSDPDQEGGFDKSSDHRLILLEGNQSALPGMVPQPRSRASMIGSSAIISSPSSVTVFPRWPETSAPASAFNWAKKKTETAETAATRMTAGAKSLMRRVWA